MSQIKFLYKSQYVVDDIIKEGSVHPVTGGAVYKAIEQTRTNTVLQSGYITNCLATIERQHNLTYANGTLKVSAGDKVFVPNGKVLETGEFLFREHVLSKDVTATANNTDSMVSFMFIDTETEAWVGNAERTLVFDQDSQTYTDTAIQRVFAQEEAPRVTTAGTIWWDLTNNIIKEYSSVQSTWVDTDYSIPICRVTKENGTITGILQDFLTSGYCCYVMWVNPGNQFLMSQGREENGTFEVVSLTTDNVLVKVLDNGEVYEDYNFYITLADEILGPVEQLSYDSSSGYYITPEGEQIVCAKVSTATAEHLTTAANDPLTITSFVAQDCLHLADQNDVEYLIRLIGSSTGDTIDTLLARINDLSNELDSSVANLEQSISDTANSLKTTVDEEVVHKSGEETITGVKTFSAGLIGNVTGVSSHVNKENTNLKVLYPCGVETTTTGEEKLYVNTTVKVGPNYVEATEFRGVSTHTRWADLAEKYLTDKEYPAGTLLKWGGEKELTASTPNCVNAVISEAPAHLMNADSEGQPIALAGRVRVRVKGTCQKFQVITTSDEDGVGVATDTPSGLINIRALEDKNYTEEGLVLCVVNLMI